MSHCHNWTQCIKLEPRRSALNETGKFMKIQIFQPMQVQTLGLNSIHFDQVKFWNKDVWVGAVRGRWVDSAPPIFELKKWALCVDLLATACNDCRNVLTILSLLAHSKTIPPQKNAKARGLAIDGSTSSAKFRKEHPANHRLCWRMFMTYPSATHSKWGHTQQPLESFLPAALGTSYWNRKTEKWDKSWCLESARRQ